MERLIQGDYQGVCLNLIPGVVHHWDKKPKAERTVRNIMLIIKCHFQTQLFISGSFQSSL